MLKNIFYITSLFIFIIFTAIFYFSDNHINQINKIRSSYLKLNNVDNTNLPLLKNDTVNIIEYKNEVESFKKRKKYKFWELFDQ
tara:strand:- start:353 stop:604 length:252 start_codon:yes stop_codon:yes gene_type:complete